jgi:hypothetical protein
MSLEVTDERTSERGGPVTQFVWQRDAVLLAFSVLLASAAYGCGDDGEDDDGGAGTAGSAGSGGSGGSNANVSCTPGGGGACTNDDDCPKVESGEIRTSAQTCGLGCLEEDDPGPCAVTCIVMETAASPACATCYAGVVKCASDNCLAQCGADPTSDECNQCQIDAGCRTEFDACSGLDSDG